MILNYHYWSEQVQYVTITREDNDMFNCTGAIYANNDIKLSWFIGSGVDYDEN